MTESYGVALEYGHGKLYYLSNPYGPKVDQPMPTPDLDSLLGVLASFSPGMGRIILMQLDCPEVNLTDQERAWRDIPPAALQERLGIPVRRVSDIKAVVQGIAAQDESVAFPYGILLPKDSDDPEKGGGCIRHYRVTDRKHWKALPFQLARGGESDLLHIGSPGILLSQSTSDIEGALATFITNHPDINRLVVWSPDGLPFQSSTYHEPRPDNSGSCQVTMLSNSAFALSSVLRHA